MNLTELGWNDHFENSFAGLDDAQAFPARVASDYGTSYLILTERGDRPAEAARGGSLASGLTRPAVGDWVAARERPNAPTQILALLDRRGAFVRKAPGKATAPQVLAANVDWAFLICGLDGDFSPRRIERYLTLTWESGATPVVVLNKADLCGDAPTRMREAEEVAMGAPVHVISAATGNGLGELQPYLACGKTAVLLGSSGTGKSTLVNALMGRTVQETQAVREDDSRGRHTTTRRELMPLPSGALLIDTPGMRELQLWASEESIEETFDDIRALAVGCRFRDCTHEQEPGCAVRQAIDEGFLSDARFNGYRKLKREAQYLARAQDRSAQLAEKARWRRIAMDVRRIEKGKR
ncbi:MAG TPA: ribosome small subunit-dependent GTPase A [Candidatus Hydrogenedentes bacterium]|nr:ribosome small subunit-dependent GTPase A [Candidatus Hydrogenedentota bacterium]HOS01589.1 ribosome small subunit-dependent GTPase A [Candidatus Hydrogenedentota bacterium]